MLNIISYIFGSISIGFIVETLFFSLLYELSNKFSLLPYRLFGFSGINVPAPPFPQLAIMLLLFTPFIVTTSLIAYLTRSYRLSQFAVSIALANVCTFFLQILLFSDPNKVTYMPETILDQAKVFFVSVFMRLVPIIVLLASLVWWTSWHKFTSSAYRSYERKKE